MRIESALAELGIEFWRENGKETVMLNKNDEALAGVYLAILGSAQELNPENIERITKARELTTGQAQDFLVLTQLYDGIVDKFLRPGCLGRLAGRKGRSLEDVRLMEEKIWQAFQKKEE